MIESAKWCSRYALSTSPRADVKTKSVPTRLEFPFKWLFCERTGNPESPSCHLSTTWNLLKFLDSISLLEDQVDSTRYRTTQLLQGSEYFLVQGSEYFLVLRFTST